LDDLEIVRDWFAKSARSLRLAKVIVDHPADLLDEAPYNCQQSAEKAMKGFLAFHKVRFGKTHDLEELIQAIAQIDPKLAQILSPAASLSRFAVSHRYPSAGVAPVTIDQMNEALKLTEKVYDEISSRVPFEVFR
jgi:HEPN domain-containing protein